MLREIVGRSEGDIRIGSHLSVDAECQPVQIFDYLIVIPPQHGTICYRIEALTIRFNSAPDREKCIGGSAISKVQYYRPNGNYVGIDKFEYQAVFMSRISGIVDVNLTIIPANDPQAEGSESAAMAKFQSTGPVSKCAEPVSQLNLAAKSGRLCAAGRPASAGATSA
jgi:hypothetical protein